MILTLFRNSLLFLFLISATTPAWAESLFIYYDDTTQYNYVKTKFEAMGFTVSGSSSGTVSSSDVTGKDMVFDIAGTSNCGSTCRSVYKTYIAAGGTVWIAGEGAWNSNRNNNIEALVENSSNLNLGSVMNRYQNNCNNNVPCYAQVANTSYISNFPTNTMHGTASLFSASGGHAMTKNWSGSSYYGTYVWDYGSNGGRIIVSLDQDQFENTSYATQLYSVIEMMLEEEGVISNTSYTSSISNAQTTQVTTSRAVTGSGIYINQVGNDNELDIIQDGEDNLIAGVGSTSTNIVNADITGNNNDNTMTQRGNNNVILFDMVGHSNTTVIDQGGSTGADDNRLEFDIVGNSNTFNATQKHNDGVGTNGHYVGVDIDGSNNNVLTSQLNDGDKKAFLSVQGDDNDIDLYQQGAGSHYAEIAVGSDQTVAITQDGTGDHNASVNMTGHSATLNLTQDSSTSQVYSIQQYCNTANGCGTTSVTQN
jgi:hypothetical protein